MRGSAQNPPAAQGDKDSQGEQRQPGDGSKGTGWALVRLGTGGARRLLAVAVLLLGVLLAVAVLHLLGGSGTGGARLLLALPGVVLAVLGKVRRLGVVPVHRGSLGSGTPAVGAL